MLSPSASFFVIMAGAWLSGLGGILSIADAPPPAMNGSGWAALVAGVIIAGFGYAGRKVDRQYNSDMAAMRVEVLALRKENDEFRSSRKAHRATINRWLREKQDMERYVARLECQLGIAHDGHRARGPLAGFPPFRVVDEDDAEPEPDEDDFGWPSATPPDPTGRGPGAGPDVTA